MKIKKIAALGVGLALLAGASVSAATLSDFVQLDGTTLTSPTIVIGDTAKTEDVIAGIDIGAAVAGFATNDVTLSGSGASATVTGGKDISTTNTKLYFGDALNKAGLRTTMTANDLPTVLASGSVQDTAGAEYTYDQYINMGGRTVTFGDSGGDLTNSAPIVDLGYSASSPAYTMKVVFNKPINITSADVQTNTVELFGSTWTIGSTSTATSLVLFGGSNKQVLTEGDESLTVSIDGVDHTVQLLGVSDTNTVVVKIDGVTKTLTKQQQYTINGAAGKVDVYVEDVYYYSKQGTISQAQLSFGSSKITLTSGQRVKVGTTDYIDGTEVTLTGSPLSTIEIKVSGGDTSTDYVAAGQKLVDPVFGTFALSFGGLTPEPMDSSRTQIEVSTSGDRSATLKFTDYRGIEKSFVFAYDNDSDVAVMTSALQDSNKYRIHVVEGEAVNLREYVVLSQGEFSHMYQVTNINNVGDAQTADATIQLTDVFSGETTDLALVGPGYTNGTAYIDGQTYLINATSTEVKFTWGATATFGGVGTETVVFPGLWGKNGEYVVLLDNRTLSVANGSSYSFPGSTTPQTLVNTTNSYDFGQVTYVFNWNGGLTGSLVSVEGVSAGPFPAVLVLEEKGKDASGTEVQNIAVVATTTGSASPYKMQVSSDVAYSDTAALEDKTTADSYVTYDIDRYGLFGVVDSENQGKVTLYYPDDQAIANVAMGAAPVWTVGSGSSGGTYAVAVPIKNPIAKFAAEVDTNNLAGDLILIGGPCVNDLVRDLLADEGLTCGTWDKTTGIIRVVENAFNSGQKALIVAGTTKTDTRNLADNYVIKGTLAYDN
ncbi:MAG: S-layer protein [Candidatus Aenigmarchaeota archaeon]|nr:S-layer protein [Candidatus Aenigmarchaeota archaeon]